MKKFLLCCSALFLLGVANVFAQDDDDATHYIQNAGFDEDLTWNADGSKKGPSIRTTTLSDRSIAYVTEDGSLYATVNPTTPKNRPDGRTLEATNGFIGQIQGWDAEKRAGDKCEWVYFGTLPYDLLPEAIPVADDGSTYFKMPEKPTEFDGGTGALYLRAGWTGSFSYKQEVSLPCALYRLEYWTINVNANTSTDPAVTATDLTKITCLADVFKEDEGTSLKSTEWTKHEFEFMPVDKITIEFGMKVSNHGSGSTPWVCIDGIKLTKIGEGDPIVVEKQYLQYLQGILDPLSADLTYQGVQQDAFDLMDEVDDAISSKDMDKMKAAEEKILAMIDKLQALTETSIPEYEALVDRANALLSETHYPGYDDFKAALLDIVDRADTVGLDGFIALIAELNKAILDYKNSVEATFDNPVDVTDYIQNPYFTTNENRPTIERNEDGSIASVTYPNADNYTADTKEPADGTPSGWYKAGTTEGDQTYYYNQGRFCWNAWRTNSSDVAVAQDITGLKNGYYSVSAEMITQSDYVSNQHVFATSTLQTVESPYLQSGDWISGGQGDWTWLSTEKVLVTDGKLTIGALGSALDGSTNQTGWFCVTNFRLMYYGAEGMEAAVTELYSQALADAVEKANGMKLAADRAAYLAAIAEADGGTTIDEINEKLAALNEATKTADASITRYQGVITGSYATLKAGEGYTANQKAVANKAVEIMDGFLNAPDATYTQMDSLTTILREYYLNSYIKVLGEAEALNIKDATAKGAMANTINEQVAALTAITTFPTKEVMDAYVAQLQKAIAIGVNQDAIAQGDGADVSTLIVNANIDAITGWTVNKPVGDGNGRKTGQQYDGNTSGGYIDSYNSTAGNLVMTVSQTLENIPNGIYAVKAMTRASGTPGEEGVYLFGINGTDTLNAVFAAAHVKPTPLRYSNPEAALEYPDSVTYNTDAFGEIWMAAADACADGGINEEELLYQIYAANDFKGRGWFYTSYQIEVTTNSLTLGVTCDSTFTEGHNDTDGKPCTPFTGTWYSADNFELTLVKNNQPDFNLATAVETIEQKNVDSQTQFFSIDGRRVRTLNNVPAGIYIIRQNGTARKVLVK